MKRIILLLSIFIYSFTYGQINLKVDSTRIVTTEGIGEHLSELLLNRGDITESEIAVSINKMFPNEDLSKFEDSPANFILSIFKGYEALLPQYWDRLLINADSLNLFDNVRYVRTFFFQTHKDKYKCVAVLKNSKKFYALTYEVLEWENDSYFVINVNDKLGEFKNIDKLIENYSTKLFDLEDDVVVPPFERTSYKYNDNVSVKIKNISIPSFNSFVEKLTLSISEAQVSEELISCQKNKSKDEIIKNWEKLISFIQKNDFGDLQCHETTINNIDGEDFGEYNLILSYRFNSKNIKYRFSCTVSLVNDNWCLINFYPFEEFKPEFQF